MSEVSDIIMQMAPQLIDEIVVIEEKRSIWSYDIVVELTIYAVLAVLLSPFFYKQFKALRRANRIAAGEGSATDEPIAGQLTDSLTLDGYQVDEGLTTAAESTYLSSSGKHLFFEIWKPDDVEELSSTRTDDPAIQRALDAMFGEHVMLTKNRVRLEFIGQTLEDRDAVLQDAIELVEMTWRAADALWERWETRGLEPDTIAGQRAARLLLRYGPARPGSRAVAEAQSVSDDAELRVLAGLLTQDTAVLVSGLDAVEVPDTLRFRAAKVVTDIEGDGVIAARLDERLQSVGKRDDKLEDRISALIRVAAHLNSEVCADLLASNLARLPDTLIFDALPVIRKHATREALTPLVAYRDSGPSSRVADALDSAIESLRDGLGAQPAGGLALADEVEGGLSVQEGQAISRPS